MNQIELWQVGIGVALFLAGLGIGFLLRRGDASAKKRVGQLQEELAEATRRHEAQQAAVEKHFEKTSDLFRDLTENYTALYGHLAEGARTLCPEGGPALGSGLANPLLEGGLKSDTDLSNLEPLDDLEDLADLTPPQSAGGPEDLTTLDESPNLSAEPSPGALDDLDEEAPHAEESEAPEEKRAS